MRKSISILIVVMGLYGSTKAQFIPLDSCVSWAYQTQQFQQELNYLTQGQGLAMDSHKHYNLPKFEIDGNATYQNENISIQVPPVPGFESPTVPLNFNRLLVNFNQTIYNGGVAGKKRDLDSLTYNGKAYGVEIKKTQVKAQVTGFYGSVILAKAQLGILMKQKETLSARITQLTGAVESGVAFRSDLLSLEAERLNLDQRVTEIEFLVLGLLDQLSELTGHTLDLDTEFALPDYAIEDNDLSLRPEFKMLTANYGALESQKKLTSVSRQPYVGLFGSVGLGYPGYDIFNPNVRPMALVGLKVKWNIVDWGVNKNTNQILSLNQSIINQEQQRLAVKFNAQLVKEVREIEKYEVLLTQDLEILQIRKSVAEQVGARLAGGTATSTDYLVQLNNEAMAALNVEVHDIKLKLAKINYRLIQGK
jgi:outer membrane protein TolC